MNRFFFTILLLTSLLISACRAERKLDDEPNVVHFVFMSDSHFGLTRMLDGQQVTTAQVHERIAEAINSLPMAHLPGDGGVGGGELVGGIELIIHGGDMVNRQEGGVQPASDSWSEFENFLGRLTTRSKGGANSEIFLIPGNHDVSNAIGFHRTLTPTRDESAMVGIYNQMMQPERLMDTARYDYPRDLINVAVDRFGIRFLFLNIWPDRGVRNWMESRLEEVGSSTPVLLFAHDELAIPSKHLTNPTYPHAICGKDSYENITTDTAAVKGSTLAEQRQFAQFVEKHSNIKAYFHGNTNYNEYYVYNGPDNNIQLHAYRVDSPMKGEQSAKEQSLLSFQVVSIDQKAGVMSVRECFWARGGHVEWGSLKSISLH